LVENKIIVQQAYYGELNKGHACLANSIDNPDLISQLITFTDRPDALIPGIELTPFFSGMALLTYYVFMKTFPDASATRAGMVFTHVLIINQNDIDAINNLDDIFSHFVDTVPGERTGIDTLHIDVSEKKYVSSFEFQPKFIQEIINSFLGEVSPILFSGDDDSFQLVLQKIWNIPVVELRKRMKFRTSFTPSDIEDRNDLTIVSIQKEFLPKWSDRPVIQSENNELVEIVSHAESFFLGNKKDNPFYLFLVDLNVNLSNISNYKQIDKVFNHLSSIDKLEDADSLRQNIRVLSLISPSSIDGVEIKGKFIKRLDELVNMGLETNIKALRNINWSAFTDGEINVKQILSDFIIRELSKNTQFQLELIVGLFDIAFNEQEKTFWHTTIRDAFKQATSTSKIAIFKNIWKILDYSEETLLINIFTLIPYTTGSESSLLDNIPAVVQEKTSKTIVSIFKDRKWYLLHAEILLRHMEIINALKSQLKLEEKEKFDKSIGVKYIVEKLGDNQLIDLTLSTCDNKLIQITVDRILKKKSLLKELNVDIPCWLNIWSSTLKHTKSITEGIEGNEQKVVDSILDLIIAENPVPEIIIELIATSIYSDISNYKNRDKCWVKIPSKYRVLFLNSTATGIIKKYLLDEVDVALIETSLVDVISSDSFITNYLYEHRENIEAVIKVYDGFLTLKDHFLSDYVKYYSKSITKEQSIELGILVNKKKFKQTARIIYDKSKKNDSFKISFEYCKNLVNLKFMEKVWSGNRKSNFSQPSVNYKNNNKKELYMTKGLPTVVILTAIQEEYNAVRMHLKDINDADKNNTSYELGIFEFEGTEIANVIIRECGAKNTIAAQETERAIQYFKPNCMFFVGIAGSRKPNDFSVGDVIFPEKIYSYEGGKSEENSFKARPDLAGVSYSLLELAKKERRKEDWKVLIKKKLKKPVKANLGIIASGDKIVEHYNSGIGNILTEHFNDTSVVEMEGFGFANAAGRQGDETSDILIGIVRGISDVIGQPQENGKEDQADRRPDGVKGLASDTAAAFAFWLILKTYQNK